MKRVIWADGQTRFPQVPFRRVFMPVKRAVPTEAEIVTAYTDGTVTLRSNRRLEGYHEAADLSGYQGVHVGDFVVHGLDILRGSVGVSDSAGAISSVCTICVPRGDAEPRYFAYAIRAQAYSGLPRALAKGIREGGADFRRWDTLAELPLPVPAAHEQRAIADYLDTETARIDTLISKKRRMIELLEEKQTATITQAVTKGIDAAAPLRAFGTAWLGKVPAHWETMPLRRVAAYRNSSIDKKSVPGQEPVKVCNYTDVYHGSYIESLDKFMESTATRSEVQRFRLRRGTVLITKDSETADDIGVPAFIPQELDAVCGYHLTVLSPFQSRMRGDFLYWVLESRPLRAAFEVAARGVTRFGLTAEAIGGVTVPVPPVVEQAGIARRLRADWIVTDGVIAKLELQLERLEEHRRALITAAVTGEVTVPGVAA